jgi:NADPH-dependent 2,4-dienoyl-CoA reductase/sulfur reductase-like enzyme
VPCTDPALVACFKLSTGDVEDAPALDPIDKYEVFEKDGAVYIKGEESTIKNSMRSNPKHKCKPKGQDKLVVIGGGSGTIGLLQALRENGYDAPITMISREPYLPLDRTKLSKALISDSNKIQLRPQEWYDNAGITTVSDDVTSVDFKTKTINTKTGKKHQYSKLVLAMGGNPKSLPMQGFNDLGNVFLLRTVNDVQNILGAVGESKGKKIVIIGTSFIGMEVGNALAKENTVTLVGMEKAPLERVMGAEVGNIFKSTLEKNGVTFHMEAGVEKATPSSSDSSKVGAVHLKDGTTLEADLVIQGVGVVPATDFLKDSGIELQEDGSIKVDKSHQVSGVSDVYAIGDIAQFPYFGPTGEGTYTRIEHWNVAQNQGRNVGANIARPSEGQKPYIPIFWSALGSQLRYCGSTANGWDSLVLKGEPENMKFAAYYAKGDTIAAVATMGMDPIMSKSVELMMAGKMPSKAELEAGTDPRTVSV